MEGLRGNTPPAIPPARSNPSGKFYAIVSHRESCKGVQMAEDPITTRMASRVGSVVASEFGLERLGMRETMLCSLA